MFCAAQSPYISLSSKHTFFYAGIGSVYPFMSDQMPVQNIGFEYRSYHFGFTTPLWLEGASVNSRHSVQLDYRFEFTLYPKANITIGANEGVLSGFKIDFYNIGIDLFPKVKLFDAVASLNFATGRFKVKSALAERMRNSFITIEGAIEPRLILGPVVIGIRGSYNFDISKPRWRATQQLNPENFHFRCFEFQASLGWQIRRSRK